MADTVFDALSAARDIEATGLERAQAEAIVGTVRHAIGADRDALATKADIDKKIAELRADLYRALWMQAGIIVAAVVALVKLLP